MSLQSDDGLAALTNRREQAVRQRRQVPPPRHQKPDRDADPARPTPATALPNVAPEEAPVAPLEHPAQPGPATTPVQRAPRAPAESRRAGETRLAQFYVNEQIDEWLEDIRGIVVVERMNLSASAVVRH